MYNTLLLASSSASTKILLTEAKIPFKVIKQTADESEVDHSMPFEQLVIAIAQHKMNHAELPEGKEGDVIFVLTADTMGQDSNGVVHGKPKDRADAIVKIEGLTDPHTTATGFCLEKKLFKDGLWHTEKAIKKVVAANSCFLIPDNWIERYLEHSWGLKCSSAIAIEGYGEQFLDVVNGSYTTIKGLPMFQLRQALEEMGFY